MNKIQYNKNWRDSYNHTASQLSFEELNSFSFIFYIVDTLNEALEAEDATQIEKCLEALLHDKERTFIPIPRVNIDELHRRLVCLREYGRLTSWMRYNMDRRIKIYFLEVEALFTNRGPSYGLSCVKQSHRLRCTGSGSRKICVNWEQGNIKTMRG